MSTTYQEYKERVQFKGASKRAYVNRKVEESINDLISNSQYGFTIVKDGQEYDVAILSTSSTQDYEKANIIAHNNVGLDRGSLFKWNDENWIVLQKMFRPEQPGFNGYAYRCTGELKWIDEDGKLQIRPGYISSGRTTNSLTYTPDVNYKYDNVLLHDTDWSMIAAVQQDLTLHAEMRFIIKGKAYRVTNVDNVSIDNVSILSMVDDKLLDSDDKINGIAGYSEFSLRCDVQMPVQLFAGDIKEIPVSVIKNGVVVQQAVRYESLTPSVLEVSGTKIIGRSTGDGQIRCYLDINPCVYIDVNVTSIADHEQAVDVDKIYIDGSDYIEWNTEQTYILSNGDTCDFKVDWNNTKIKHDPEIKTDNSITISVRDKYAGTVTIRGNYNGIELEPKVVLIKTA